MHILSWIMKHPIITAWGLTALAILMNLGSGGHDKEGGHATKATTEAHAETATAQVQAKEGDTAQSNAQQSADASTAAVQPAAPAVAASTESSVKPAVQAAVATAAVATVAATANSAANAQQPAVAAQGSVTSQAAVQAPTAAVVASQAVASAPPKDVGVEVKQDIASMANKDLLFQARNAFWQHNYDQSTEYYQELVNRDPESIEYRGELGNVFWHAGKEREAAAMYVQIAEPMIAAGRGQEVLNILGFIGAYFPDQAKELMDVIQKQ